MTPYQAWLLSNSAVPGLAGIAAAQQSTEQNYSSMDAGAPVSTPPVAPDAAAPVVLPWSADPPQPQARPIAPVVIPPRDYPVAEDNQPATPTSHTIEDYQGGGSNPRWTPQAAVDSWLYKTGNQGRAAQAAAPTPQNPNGLPKTPTTVGEWEKVHGLDPANPAKVPYADGAPPFDMRDGVSLPPKGEPTIDPAVEAKGGKALDSSGESPHPASRWNRNQNWMRPETQEELLAAGRAGKEAAENIGQDESIAALDRSAAYKQQAEKQLAFETVRQKAEADRAVKIQKVGEDVDRLAHEAANAKVDPNAVFGNASFGTQLTVLVGSILGGILQGRGVTKDNQFISAMDQMTQASIDTQKADINNKWKGVDAKRSLYGDMLARFKDERTAELATKVAMNEIAATQMMSQAAEADSVIVGDRAKQAVAAIAKENATLKAQIQDRAEFVIAPTQTAQQQTALQATDVLLRSIYAIKDKPTQERAMKEFDKVRNYETKMGPFLAAFDQAVENRTLTSMLPGPALRTATQKYESSKATVLTLLKALGPDGLSSDKDFENFLEKRIPGPLESPEAIALKRMQLIDSLRPPTPFLNGLGRNPLANPLEH